MLQRHLQSVFLSAILIAGPATAQQQTSIPYGIARDWNVSVNLIDGTFDTCEALSGDPSGDGWISLEAGVNGWLVNTPWPYRGEGLTGGSIGIDGRWLDTTWVRDIGQSEATASIPAGWIDPLAQGSRFEWEIEGQPAYDHSLSGSAAAILKLKECVAMRGEQPDRGTSLSSAQLDPVPVESDAARLGAGCPAWGTRPSPASDMPARLEFINGADRGVSIYWLGFDGSVSEYAGLLPGESAVMDTFAGHLWIAKDVDGTCHGGVIRAAAGSSTVVIP